MGSIPTFGTIKALLGAPEEFEEELGEGLRNLEREPVTPWGLLEGVGVPKDERRAVETFERACELGDEKACGILAAFYEDGRIVGKDPARAKTLCERVARLFKARDNVFPDDVPPSCPIRGYEGAL